MVLCGPRITSIRSISSVVKSAKLNAPCRPWLIGMPSSKTCVCSLRSPRVNTDVNWPGTPVCTTDNPGTSRKASLTRWICFCSNSSELITLALAGDRSRGISKRVADTTTDSTSASAADGVGVVTCAQQMTGTKPSNAANRIGERTRLACTFRWLAGKHVFSDPLNTTGQRPVLPGILMLRNVNIQVSSNSESRDLLGLECFRSVASPSSHSSFCEEVCAVAASQDAGVAQSATATE